MAKPSKRKNPQSSFEDISQEIKALNERIQKEAPTRGFTPPLHQQVAFRTLPISENTLQGLDNAKKTFQSMTAIQHACIPHALADKDILGAARTGR
jgi:ATP-dependent RNA helicase DDX10/DBP4